MYVIDDDDEAYAPTYRIHEERDLDLQRLTTALTEHVAQIETQPLRVRCTEYEQLTYEALDCARSGLFEDALHRIRLRDEPAWSEQECKLRYKAAMRERHEVSSRA